MRPRAQDLSTVLALACGIAIACAAPPAAADPSSKAIEEFRAGRALAVAGKCDEAIPRFRASLAIAPAVGPLMNLGDCLAKVGKTMAAVRAFEEAASLARRSHDGERAEASEKHAERLRASLSTLTVRAPRSLDRPVLVDGVAVAVGIATQVDGGEHVITVETEDGRTITKKVQIAATGEARVVDLGPELASAPAPATPAERSGARPAQGWSSLRIGAIAAGSAGLAALGVGTVLGLGVFGRRADIDALCPAYPRCDRDFELEVRELHDKARHEATFATVALVAGVLLVGTAVGLLIADARRPPTFVGSAGRPRLAKWSRATAGGIHF